MKESTYKNYDDLPLFLNAEKDFPTLRVGSRMVVPKEKFIEWVEQHTKDGGEM